MKKKQCPVHPDPCIIPVSIPPRISKQSPLRPHKRNRSWLIYRIGRATFTQAQNRIKKTLTVELHSV